MSRLIVPGANLHYETVGKGPMLLCISGADGSCEIWRGFAECLKHAFTVVMWDRRGFSRSYLTGAQDYSQCLETDADDAARLIEHISRSEPATVIGNSSGAIVSLKLLVRHPDMVKTVLPYEPPAARMLPDFEELWKRHEKTYAIYRASGVYPALEEFATLTKADQRMLSNFIDPSRGQYVFSNVQYWFEREFMYYSRADFDIDGELRPLKDKLVLLLGELSPKDAYQYRANAVLGEKLGLKIMHFPGEHVGHATHAKEFSEKLIEVLKGRV